MKSALAIVAIAAAWPLAAAAQPPAQGDRDALATVAALEQSVVDAIARAEPSVVAIARTAPPQASLTADVFGELRGERHADKNPATVATGVIIDSAGLVLTQYLAVREGEEHTITTTDGKTHAASLRAADPRSGLAVLALQRAATFPALRFGDAAKLRKGHFVITLGNPFAIASDGQPTASWGIVTNLARKAPPPANLNDAPGPLDDYRTTLHHLGTLIQTDARLGWSAGGGALINLQGELVGITTTASTIAGHEQPAGYAIPINATFRRIIDTLKQGREVEYGMLGVSFGSNPIQAAPRDSPRVTVGQVFPGTPAERAGLQTGDVVTRVGNQPIDDIDTMQLAVSLQPPSASTTIEYERAGQRATTNVTLAKLAVAGKKIVTVRPESWHGLRVDYATALDSKPLLDAIESGAYDAEGCVLVAEVEPESAAWQAGVRPGMFISHVGGERVATPADFRAAASKAAGPLDIRLTRPGTPSAQKFENEETDSDRKENQR